MKLSGNYITRQRGWHTHKGKGQLPTYWLCGQGDNILSSYTKEEMMEEEAKKQVNQVLEQVQRLQQILGNTHFPLLLLSLILFTLKIRALASVPCL